MNGKKAKALRREAGYHPTDPRKYGKVETGNSLQQAMKRAAAMLSSKAGKKPEPRVLHPECSRAKYQALKKGKTYVVLTPTPETDNT